jgi:hypothetical protein
MITVSTYRIISLSRRFTNRRCMISQMWLEPCGFTLSNHHFFSCLNNHERHHFSFVSLLRCRLRRGGSQKRNDHLTFPSPPLPAIALLTPPHQAAAAARRSAAIEVPAVSAYLAIWFSGIWLFSSGD